MEKHCTRELFEGQVIGDACPDCGHTNVVHPGEHNPAVAECVLCVLVTGAQRVLPKYVGSPDPKTLLEVYNEQGPVEE